MPESVKLMLGVIGQMLSAAKEDSGCSAWKRLHKVRQMLSQEIYALEDHLTETKQLAVVKVKQKNRKTGKETEKEVLRPVAKAA